MHMKSLLWVITYLLSNWKQSHRASTLSHLPISCLLPILLTSRELPVLLMEALSCIS